MSSKKPLKLRMILAMALAVFSAACAQMPTTGEHHEADRVTQNSSANEQPRNDSVVIFIYPKSGRVSDGQYFRLPLTEQLNK